MKDNQPVTGVEKEFGAEVNILSITDLKGIITYTNQDFIDISGFSNDELLHKNHNVVRHPDMPPAAFENLWSTIANGKPWMGVVKNRCKNGDHYWVDAFVTPVIKDGKTVEYQSMRFRPERKSVDRAENLYKRIREGKTVKASLGSRLGVRGRLIIANTAAILPLAITALVPALSPFTLAGLAFSLLLILAANLVVMKPLTVLMERARRIFNNPLMSKIYTGRDDEFGQLQLALRMRRSQLNAVVGRIADSTQQLSGTARVSAVVAEQAHEGVATQQEEVMQVSTAMTEMAATVQEVARNAATTVEHTSVAQQESANGQQVIHKTIAAINGMTDEIQEASGVIQRLSETSENIGGILSVIKGIAEQTNLLALNAAIEAARAGEQGRGFAVVADEVRTLAGRTQESTKEIESMIEHIQQGTAEGVQAMDRSCDKAENCKSVAASAEQALGNITEAVNRINDMAHQIATASEEQSAVAEEINQNVISINSVAEDTARGAMDSVSATNDMSATIVKLSDMVGQFMDKRA